MIQDYYDTIADETCGFANVTEEPMETLRLEIARLWRALGASNFLLTDLKPALEASLESANYTQDYVLADHWRGIRDRLSDVLVAWYADKGLQKMIDAECSSPPQAAETGPQPVASDQDAGANAAGRLYLIWSNEHHGWWKPYESGCSPNISDAAVYDESAMTYICQRATINWNDKPYDIPVLVGSLPPIAQAKIPPRRLMAAAR